MISSEQPHSTVATRFLLKPSEKTILENGGLISDVFDFPESFQLTLSQVKILIQKEVFFLQNTKINLGGGTTDYAVDIYKKAIAGENYTCYLKPDSSLPMMHVDDCLRATHEFMKVFKIKQ